MMNTRGIFSWTWLGSDSGNITVAVPGISATPGNNLYLGVKMISTFNGFYNIFSTNNIFTYTSNTPAPNTVHTITLAPGSYNISAINSAIQQGMLTIGEPAATVNQFLISIYYPNVGTTINSPFNFDFTVPNSINTILGFNPLVYTAGFYVSQNAANISDNDVINIVCNVVTNGYTGLEINSSNLANPTQNIYTFSANNNIGGLIQYTESNPVFLPCNTNNITSLRFTLKNKFGVIVQNPGQYFTIVIQFVETPMIK